MEDMLWLVELSGNMGFFIIHARGRDEAKAKVRDLGFTDLVEDVCRFHPCWW